MGLPDYGSYEIRKHKYVELPMTRPAFFGLITAFVALAVDQATKAIIVANDAMIGEGIGLIPGFNLVHVRNDGVAFGAFGGAPWWSLVVLALCISIFLAVLMLQTKRKDEALAYGAIIGGALGNVVDRLRLRAVTDFLDFYIGEAHWPAFNFADVSIVSGAIFLVFLSTVEQRAMKKK